MSQAAIVVQAPAVDLRPTRPACVRPLPPLHVTPVLRVDTAQIAADYRTLAAALPRVALHYAIKANPAAAVLRTLLDLGARWDVASPGEIDAVLAVGGSPADLSYGNTIKRAADIAYAFGCGLRQFTVDSPGELTKIIALAPGATVLVRIATSGAGADWALGGKFGCPEQEAAALLLTAAAAGHPVGVAFHVGTQQRNPQAWDEPLATTARLRAGLRLRGLDLSVVDVGGGFPAAMLGDSPAIGEYGAAITASIRRHLGVHPPALMAEPGRCIVADAGELETEVVLVSERDGARWVYLDAGLFTGLVESIDESLRYRIEVRRDGAVLGGPVGPVVLAGPTCDSLDVLYEKHRYLLPLDLRPGDRLTFLSAGAYIATYSTVGFNGFAPLREVYR
jgi:ornithine decarboxylase